MDDGTPEDRCHSGAYQRSDFYPLSILMADETGEYSKIPAIGDKPDPAPVDTLGRSGKIFDQSANAGAAAAAGEEAMYAQFRHLVEGQENPNP